MKAAILVSMILFAGLAAQAKTLNIVSQQSLSGMDGIDIHLEIRPDGSIISFAGRSMPQTLTIKNVDDERDRDGNLVITFTNGVKLIEASGFTIAGTSHLFLETTAGKRIEMVPMATLQVK